MAGRSGKHIASSGVKRNDIGVALPGSERWQFNIRQMCLFLAIISFLLYVNTLRNGYVMDDATVITQNVMVKQGFKGIPELLFTPRLKGFEQADDRESYRPIPMVLSAMEYQLFSVNPAEGHFVNIMLFIGCVLVFFFFLDSLFHHQLTGVAFIAALLFAMHPVHTEVVANIKSKDELLCFLFAFLSLNRFIGYVRTGRLLSLVAGSLMLLLSFLCRETVIAFLVVIPLVFFFYINENRKRSIHICLAAFLVAACYLGARSAVLGVHHVNAVVFVANPLLDTPFSSRIATAFVVLGMYLKLTFVPYPLICDYSYNSIPLVGFDNVFALVSLALYSFLAVIGIYRVIKKPGDPWAFGILFFLATVALFSNIPFLVYSEMAERFLFFGSAGICLLMALAIYKWVAAVGGNPFSCTGRNVRMLLALVPVALIFSSLTVIRNTQWKDNCTLFSVDITKAPNNSKLCYYLATCISQNLYSEETDITKRRELDRESIDYLDHALEIYPDFSEAHSELGRIYDRLQLLDSAMVHDKKAIELNPTNSIATYNLARAYYALKKYPDAIGFFKKNYCF